MPAGFALSDVSGTELTETEWVCANAANRLPINSFRLDTATTGARTNCILQAPEGDARYVNDNGQREWIPDAGTWYCEVARGVPVIITSRAGVDHLVDAGWHSCLS